MKETKKELRKRMAALKTRFAASASRMSAEVMAALEAHPAFKAADTVLLYHSLHDEVDTRDFICKWSRQKRILLPAVIGEEVELRLYTDSQEMVVGKYGIEEPSGASFTDYAAVGFIAVPGVAFDRSGNRLGRGKGYYDRLLPHMPSAFKAGICFPYQLVDEVPAEEHDIRMDCIITAPSIGK